MKETFEISGRWFVEINSRLRILEEKLKERVSMKNRCWKCESISEDVEGCLGGILERADKAIIELKRLDEKHHIIENNIFNGRDVLHKINGIITLTRRLKEIEEKRFEFEKFAGLDEDFGVDIEGNRYTGPKMGSYEVKGMKKGK